MHLSASSDVLSLLIGQRSGLVSWLFLARIKQPRATCNPRDNHIQRRHQLSPGSRIPDARASNTRRRASPGLMLPPPLLTHFSTSNSIACVHQKRSKSNTQKEAMQTDPLIQRRPCWHALTEIPENANDHDTRLQAVGSSLNEYSSEISSDHEKAKQESG